MKLKCQKLKKTIASARVTISYKKKNQCITTLQMNKCLVRKLLEAGQRIEKSISRPPPPSNFFSFQDISRISWTQFILPPDQPLKGGGVKDFLLNSLQDISRVFLKDFFCLPPQAILKPSGGELGCAPNLAFLWIGLGRRCASTPALLNWLFQKQKYFDEKPLRTP